MAILPNKKVLGATQGNRITIKDVRTRTRFWYKPFDFPNWTDQKGEKIVGEPEQHYLELIMYTGWEPWKDNYKFIPMPQIWEEIVGGQARRGIVKQLDDFMKGYYDSVKHLPLRPKQDAQMLRRNWNIFDTDYEKAREKELTDRAMAGREYVSKRGRASEFPVEIPVKNAKGETIESFFINQRATFQPLEYFVVANANNTITINTINTRQLDFLKPNIVFFWGGNKWTSKAKTKKTARKMYWCRSVSYINDLKGWCQLVLEQCDFWMYWGDAANSRGRANIMTSQLGMTHGDGENETHSADEPAGNYQNEKYCRACDMCFDFCGDLRLKRAVPMGYRSPRAGGALWQPKWKLLAVHGDQMGGMMSGFGIPDDDGGVPLVVPSSIRAMRFAIAEGEKKANMSNNFSGSPKPTLFFLVAKDHFGKDSNKRPTENTPFSNAIHKPSKGEDYWEELPACYAEQPHLLNHSTLQCFFQKKLLFTANYKHLKVRKFIGGSGTTGIAKDGLMFKLGYHIIERSSIAGILYNFESGDIFFKWEMKVEGQEEQLGLLDALIAKIEAFFGGDEDSINANLGQAKAAQSGGFSMNPFAGFVRLFKIVKAAGVAWLKKQIAPDPNSIMDGKKMKEKTGLKDDKGKAQSDKSQAQAEEQTKRMKASTAKALYRAVEPSIFYSNTISMNYSFFEFSNRSISNPFMFRNEHSNLQYDNLVNNNNKNPIQTFNCKFSQLKQTLTEGDWAGTVNLFDFPHKGFFESILADTTLYKNPQTYFKPWRPKFKTLQSFTYADTSNVDTAQGQEEADVEEIKRKKEDIQQIGEFNEDDKVASYETYLYTDDDNLYTQIRQHFGGHTTGAGGTVDSCWSSSPIVGQRNAFCWGCDCKAFEAPITSGGEVHFLSSKGGSEQVMTVPDDCVIICDPKRGVFEVKTTIEWTDKNYKYNFKFDRLEMEKEQEIIGIDYKEPIFEPNETDAELEISFDNDEDKEDIDFEAEAEGMEAGEKEEDDDWDDDIDKDKDKEEDDDPDDDSDDDNDIELESDTDSDNDSDVESDNDTENEDDQDDYDNGKDDDDVDTGG